MDKAEHCRLTALIRESSVPLEPEIPPLPPDWEASRSVPLSGMIRAVLFDVYGTLFCSTAGDIGLPIKESGGQAGFLNRTEADSDRATALDALARQYGLSGAEIRSFFHEKVSEIHRSRYAETPQPEVRVEEIWTDFLRERGLGNDEAAGRELALRYELAVNPVYPMPGAVETIAALRASGRVLGIVSNAQFFTPLLFEAFFNAPAEQLGFTPSLLIWSFAMGSAKPSPVLFNAAARELRALGISPAETAFVGNDMLSDIYGSSQAGFQGILFAGDRRSLRLRENDSLTQGLRPVQVIQNLTELIGHL